MLNAILKSKAGRLHVSGDQASVGGEGVRWREIFSFNEDLLTATFFERLSYLPSADAVSLLQLAAGEPLPDLGQMTLTGIEFWPQWHLKKGERIEPDVFLSFAQEDPPRKVQVIVEDKLAGNPQYVAQWSQEVRAWLQEVADSSVDSLLLLAVGGFADPAMQQHLCETFRRQLQKISPGVPCQVVTMDWPDIARACGQLHPETPAAGRIVEDIAQALALCGYGENIWPAALEQMAPLEHPQETLKALAGLAA